jgi:membrane protease subunit (stomatin/prohibitin family)
MALMDMIKWDGTPDVFAWKFPEENIRTFSQLIVNESQEAVLFGKGQILGKFGPGKHTISNENIPLLEKLYGIPFGGKNPFTAEIWFVNKAMPLDVKWGTPAPIQLKDPTYQIMVPVRAFGQFGVQIQDAEKFLVKLVGTLPSFDQTRLSEYFKGLLLATATTVISQKITNDRISILEINAQLLPISEALKQNLAAGWADFGIGIVNFFVDNISVPDDDPAVVKLRDALARKAEMNIVGYNYQQEQQYEVLKTAAGNQGMAGNMMGAGIGMGMGFGVGTNMGGMMNGMMNQNMASVPCPKCNSPVPTNSKFCPNCGNTMGQIQQNQSNVICDKCGKEFPATAKFCPHCGDPYNPCPKCGADNPDGAANCIKCGGAMPRPCPKCGFRVESGVKFCPDCGQQL